VKNIDIKNPRAIILVGEGKSGKSMLVNFFGECIEEKDICYLSLNKIVKDKFGIEELLNKKLNISNEDDLKLINNNIFKAIITGSKISINRIRWNY